MTLRRISRSLHEGPGVPTRAPRRARIDDSDRAAALARVNSPTDYLGRESRLAASERPIRRSVALALGNAPKVGGPLL